MSNEQKREVLSVAFHTPFNLMKIDEVLTYKNYLEVIVGPGITFQIRKMEHNYNSGDVTYYEVRRILHRIGELKGEVLPRVVARTEKKPMNIMRILTSPDYGFGEYPDGEYYMFKFDNGLIYHIRKDPIDVGWVLNSSEIPILEGWELGSFCTEEDAKEFARGFMDYLYLPDEELIEKDSVQQGPGWKKVELYKFLREPHLN